MSDLKKIGAIGDVHGEHEVLERVILFLKEKLCDEILCLGDIVDGPGDVDRCLELLQKHQISTIKGNHERWFLSGEQRSLKNATTEMQEANKNFIKALPSTLEFDTVAGRLLACHGIAENDMAIIYPDTRGYALQEIVEFKELMLNPDVKWMLGGHTHVRMVRPFQGITLINAGTLLRGHEPCFCILDFENLSAQYFNLNPEIDPANVEELNFIPLPEG